MSKFFNRRHFSLLFLLLGIGLLVYTFSPIVGYELSSSNLNEELISPRANADVLFMPGADLTKASNWFASEGEGDFSNSSIKFYTISIPKLDIENATVSIGGEDLAQSLIQYPGTAFPGFTGNTVIFGHSVLPRYYDPKNYLAIFSILDKLEKGDEINVYYDGVSYKYVVESSFEVLPTDIQVLEQSSSASYLSLITCTPPGHPLKPKRLVVRARIQPL